ncbi:MAG: hypothetical protein FJ288_01210 [Planctomycetes bacterium]|nr:hypothetical protein [Planctomycetota bacterium]
MAALWRKSRRTVRHRDAWARAVMAALPLAALGLFLMPQGAADLVRVWAGPVFSPLEDVTGAWALDLAERIRNPGGAAATAEGPPLQEQVAALQGAMAQAAALLGDYDRRLRDVARIRQSLDGLPCRVVPARLMPPEVAGGQATARLGEGTDKGIRRQGAVIAARLDRGAREAIQHGEPVLTAAGLVGVVEEVGPVTSTVRLITDPRTSLMVQVITLRGGQWRAGPEGVARGSQDGRSIAVQGIPRTSDVVPGDFVVTSPSRESSLPPYLIVGRVRECDAKPAALFRGLVVEPYASPREACEVYVLSPETGGR